MAYNKRYKMDSSLLKQTTGYSAAHPGVDLVPDPKIPGCPLYAICDGIVRDAVVWGDPTYAFGGKDSGSYVAIQANGNKPDEYLVDKVGHMSSLAVFAGQQVKDGDLIGYQGYTGYTIPAGPAGEHSHNAMYLVHYDDYANMTTVDPTPYLEGASMVINPVDPPVTESFQMAIIAWFKNTEPDFINLRESPDKNSADVGNMDAGAEFSITEIVDNPEQDIIFGNTGRGYIALTYQGAVWCTPMDKVCPPDQTAELEEAKQYISDLEQQATIHKALIADYSNRLSQIKLLCP